MPSSEPMKHDIKEKPLGVVATPTLEARLQAFIDSVTAHASTATLTKRYVGGFSWLTYGFTLSTPGPSAAGGQSQDLILRLCHAGGFPSPYSSKAGFLLLW